MLPALLGHEPVVLDRCWLSEQPYGAVFRDGSDRIGAVSRRMLERLAMSCGALVICCDPGPEVCVANWLGRKGAEYLDRADQVERVNGIYRRGLRTELTVVDYDYSQQPVFHDHQLLYQLRAECHPVEPHSAGNAHAKIALVGEAFGEVKDHDPLYQWPFASFSQHGCSRWLTEQLEIGGIREEQLFWANADTIEPGGWDVESVEHIVALGQTAHERLTELGYIHHTVGHPQHAKRFHNGQPYELIALLKELLA